VETASNIPSATASASIALPTVVSPSSSTSTARTSQVTTASFSSTLLNAAIGASAGTTLTDATTKAPMMSLGAIMPPSNGIYAVNHGRVCLSLQPSSTDASVL